MTLPGGIIVPLFPVDEGNTRVEIHAYNRALVPVIARHAGSGSVHYL